MVDSQRHGTGLRVTLDIWHPDCWTLVVTEGADGGLLGHGVYTIDEMATGRFTVYGETTAAVEALIAAVRASPLTESVWPSRRTVRSSQLLHSSRRGSRPVSIMGPTTFRQASRSGYCVVQPAGIGRALNERSGFVES